MRILKQINIETYILFSDFIAEKYSNLRVGDCVSVDCAERGAFSSQANINAWKDSKTVEVYFIFMLPQFANGKMHIIINISASLVVPVLFDR